MKFECHSSIEQFYATIDEQIVAYNATRELPHLRLKRQVRPDNVLFLKEGRRHHFIGTSCFEGKFAEKEGKLYLEGDILYSPEPTKTDWLLFLLRRTILLLLLTMVPYILVAGIALLLGAGKMGLLVSLVLPLFIGTTILVGFVRDVFFLRRRFARFLVAYMHCTMVEDSPAMLVKKQRKTSRLVRLRHLVFWWTLFYPVKLYIRLKMGFKATKKTVHPKRNFIMISNHVTDYDMIFMSLSMRKQMYFVMSEHALRFGLVSRLIYRYLAPIGRAKGNNAGSTVMDILRHARKGYNVGLFAEGFRTMSGYNSPFSPGTGAMIRRMKCDLVTYRVRGGYYANPNWSDHMRRGKIWGEFVGHYTAEELAKMTDEEVNAIIARDIAEDATLTQAEYHIPYRTKKGIAENLEFALVVCPLCHGMGKMHSEGNRFWCDCGAEGIFTEYGELVSEKFPYKTITDWSRFQQAFISELPTPPRNTILLSAKGQILREIEDVHHTSKVLCENALLTQTAEGITIGQYYFPYTDIAYFDIVRHGYLLFTTHDHRYFEVRGDKFPGMLCKMLFYRFNPPKA